MSNTLQEFLVSLRYNVNAGDQRRFLNGLEQNESRAVAAGKAIGSMGAAIVALGLVAAKGTLSYAKYIEQLGFASKRIGTHVSEIKAMQVAGESLGASQEGVLGSLEGLASFMRHMPDASGYFKSLGIEAKDAQGHILDTSKIFLSVADRLNKMPYAQAAPFYEMFGIDEKTALASRDKGFVDKFKRNLGIVGKEGDKAAESGHLTEEQARIAELKLFRIAAVAMTPAMDTLTKTINELNGTVTTSNEFLQIIAHPWDRLKENTGLMTEDLKKNAVERIKEAVGYDEIKDYFIKLGAKTHTAAAMSVMAESESGFDPQAKQKRGGAGRGLFQLENARQRDYKAWAEKTGHDPLDKASAWDQVQFAWYELTQGGRKKALEKMNAAGNSEDATRAATIYYEAPKNKELQAEKRAAMMRAHNAAARLNGSIAMPGQSQTNSATDSGAAPVQNITTTINVNGSSDPKLTAQAVSKEQMRVNQAAARNTAGAWR